MTRIFYLFIFIQLTTCHGQCQQKDNVQVQRGDSTSFISKTRNQIDLFIEQNIDDSLPSKSIGTVSNGSLINGKLFPFSGANFRYFDTVSFVHGRAFLHDKVRQTVLQTYHQLQQKVPDRMFYIMECSNKNGGKLYPHKTHQNGLSIDFMLPMQQSNKPYYGLDTLGQQHYFLDFDNNGKYVSDTSISVDFDHMAIHLLLLNKNAKKNGLSIAKVIIKVEYKTALFATANGKELKNSGIYFVQQLTPLLNGLHDDHFHVDFELTSQK